MSNFKGTIRIEKELWEEFKLYCAVELETNLSAKIRQMIQAELGNSPESSVDKREEINHQVETNSQAIRLLEARIAWLEKSRSETEGETDERTDALTDKQTEAAAVKDLNTGVLADKRTDALTDKQTEAAAVKDLNTGVLADERTDKWTDRQTKGQTSGQTHRQTSRQTKSPDQQLTNESPSELVYRDRQIAEKEKLSTVTINRYRRGLSQPQDKSFWQRWQVLEGGKAWRRLN